MPMNKTVQRIMVFLLVLLMICEMFPAALATGVSDDASTTILTLSPDEAVEAETTTPTEPVNEVTAFTEDTEPTEALVVTDPTEETVTQETTENTDETSPEETSSEEPTDELANEEMEEETVTGTPFTLGADEQNYDTALMALDDDIAVAAATELSGTHYHRAIIWLNSSDSQLKFTYNGTDYSVNRFYVHGVKVNGTRSVAYCIDPGVLTTESSGGYTGSETAWTDLDINTQGAIGLALLYGAPNGISSTDKKTMLTYELATQIVIHEIILGYRSNLPPYSCTDERIIEKFGTKANGTASSSYPREITSESTEYSSLHGQYISKAVLREAYDAISASLATHYTIPSFASRYNSAAKTYEMTKQSDGTYAVTLTDTNGILSQCTFQNGNGLTYTVSGNQLTIQASTAFSGTKSCALSGSVGASKNVPNLESETFLLWEAGSYQRIVSLQEPQNDPVPIYFNVKISTGDLQIQKNTEDGLNKGGWLFGAYSDAACTSLLAGPTATDSSGALTFKGLSAGTVWVKELGNQDAAISELYECASTNPQSVTITAGGVATVTFQNNLRYGSLTFRKATTTGQGVELGWTAKLWKLESNGTKTYIGSGTTKKDKSDPTYTFENLLPGTYILQEDPDSGKAGYSLDTTAYEVTVTAGKNTEKVITNVSLGYIQILKETNTGKDISGRKFNVFTDEALTKHFTGSPFTTDKDGKILTEAPPGVYYIQEVDESAANPGWIFDTSVKKVTVKAHETASVTFTNVQQGYGQIIKEMPDGGSAEGWPFDLHRASDNQYIATYTTGSDGTVNTDWLLPGEYLVYEKIPEDSLYYCESENPQKVTITAGSVTKVTFVNRLKPAQIEAQKTDIYGNPIYGAGFLLEWSEDGNTWQAVTYSASSYVSKGTCNSAGLTDGILTTPDSGIVTFTGLHPELYYRLTEVSTANGKQLMADVLFDGQIPTDDLTVTVRAMNDSTFVLPHTGSRSMAVLSLLLCLCLLTGSAALLTLRKKKHF